MRLRGGKVGGVKAKDLWEKNGDELLQMEEELRTELMSLRVAQQVGGQPGKVNRIKMIRKAIARVLTVQTAKRRGEAYSEVEKKKYKPLDARDNRHWTKAMRLRLNKYERSKKSPKMIRCLRAQVWGAGVRPMRRVVGFNAPIQPVEIGTIPNNDLSLEKYPRYRLGAHGRATSTGHVPEHAKAAMEKKKAAWEVEQKRVKALKDRLRSK